MPLSTGVKSIAKSGSAGIRGNVTLSQGTNVTLTQSGNDISIAASSGTSTPTLSLATIYETTGRFIQDSANGTATFGTEGVLLDTTATTTSFIRVRARSYNTTFRTFNGSPVFTQKITMVTIGTTGSGYFGLGAVTAAGTGHTFTDNHIGFKIVIAASAANLYATQADGTTETASASLRAPGAGGNLDLLLKVNSTTSVDYYTRLNGSALSTATNLTANMPAADTADNTFSQVSLANDSTATQQQVQAEGGHYER